MLRLTTALTMAALCLLYGAVPATAAATDATDPMAVLYENTLTCEGDNWLCYYLYYPDGTYYEMQTIRRRDGNMALHGWEGTFKVTNTDKGRTLCQTRDGVHTWCRALTAHKVGDQWQEKQADGDTQRFSILKGRFLVFGPNGTDTDNRALAPYEYPDYPYNVEVKTTKKTNLPPAVPGQGPPGMTGPNEWTSMPTVAPTGKPDDPMRDWYTATEIGEYYPLWVFHIWYNPKGIQVLFYAHRYPDGTLRMGVSERYWRMVGTPGNYGLCMRRSPGDSEACSAFAEYHQLGDVWYQDYDRKGGGADNIPSYNNVHEVFTLVPGRR